MKHIFPKEEMMAIWVHDNFQKKVSYYAIFGYQETLDFIYGKSNILRDYFYMSD